MVSLTPGVATTYTLDGLPVGPATFGAEAWNVACANIGTAQTNWVADPVAAKISTTPSTVNLLMRRNGRSTVGVDWEDTESGGEPEPNPGPARPVT